MRLLLAIAVFLLPLISYADSWEFEASVEEQQFVFGSTRVVRVVDARLNQQHLWGALAACTSSTLPHPRTISSLLAYPIVGFQALQSSYFNLPEPYARWSTTTQGWNDFSTVSRASRCNACGSIQRILLSAFTAAITATSLRFAAVKAGH
jgi:hypothetical protein